MSSEIKQSDLPTTVNAQSVVDYRNTEFNVQNWCTAAPVVWSSWSQFAHSDPERNLLKRKTKALALIHLQWILCAAEPRLIMYWECQCSVPLNRCIVIVALPEASRAADLEMIQAALIAHVLWRIEYEKQSLDQRFQRQHIDALASPYDLKHATVKHNSCPVCVERNREYVCESSCWCLLPASLEFVRRLRRFILDLPRPLKLQLGDKSKCVIL